MVLSGIERLNADSNDLYDYRGDEELNVYDQSCANCQNRCCPMKHLHEGSYVFPNGWETKEELEEDCITVDGKITWCIHWKGEGMLYGIPLNALSESEEEGADW